MTIDLETATRWRGRTVVDEQGEKIGKVDEIYVDERSGKPEWALIHSGLLREYVVTESVTQTVPVQRKELRVAREPITDANVDQATEGPAISEEVHEVVLHGEQVVMRKERIDVEGDRG